uniref:Ladba-7,13E-dienyl diphosphate synthase n=1 Tax=Isodon lophanthoides var. gerardianus TaxID=669302 RepID=A0A8F6T5K4_9LAMI|nr:ladba-7,13E-dienyl diphosphate synthase [Isodon lophanthoides var. gerardianus]
MASSIFTPNMNCTQPAKRNLQISAKIQLPQRFNGTWLNSRKRICMEQQYFHGKQIHKVIQSRAAKPDVSSTMDVEVMDTKLVKKAEDLISCIKTLLNTIGDGRISVSPYSTSWIALIKNIDGRDIPQFPSSLDWIVQHQLPDGSWGDAHFFCVYDRLVNTLACVIALHTWNVHADKIKKGVSYLKENIWKLENASDVHMTSGFEVIFPTLLGKARKLGIDDLPCDDIPVLAKIYAARDHKMKKIPREVMHEVMTTLLYSLEGFEDLDWARLLKLQSPNGSFLTSPSSTAYAFMQTNDHNCLKFITFVVQRFNGGAPDNYPIDNFARLWAVDRLQRLGISRFFESEIKDFLTYVYRDWNANGIYSAQDINFSDLDDTSMAFRLLRLHGYDVDPNVLRIFKEGDIFCCHSGEVTRSTSPTYALYRASQVRFPGEEILEEAYNFSRNFLQDWLASDRLLDKWIVSKDFPNEIKVGLEVPWYATLPRVEAAYYLQQHYGGSSDAWIAKTVYRMPDVTNDEYLELARLDFKKCQAQHQIELSYMQGWYENSNIEEVGISRKELVVAYFLAAATIFEPERAKERIVWVKTELISRLIEESMCSLDQKTVLLKEFSSSINGSHKFMMKKSEHRGVNIILEAIHELLEGFDECTSRQLKNVWYMWLVKFERGDEARLEKGELLVTTLNICAAQFSQHDDILLNHDYITLCKLINKICHHLSQIPNKKVEEMKMYGRILVKDSINEIRADMQALTKLVLEESCIHKNIKQTFLAVAKTFYYRAYFDADTIDLHIFKVLFEPVV